MVLISLFEREKIRQRDARRASQRKRHIYMYVCMYMHVCMNVLHSLKPREEVVEDFVRNFLVSVGLHRTADLFQAEW